MRAYGTGSVRRFRPLVAALPDAADRLTCWRAESTEHNPGRLPG